MVFVEGIYDWGEALIWFVVSVCEPASLKDSAIAFN